MTWNFNDSHSKMLKHNLFFFINIAIGKVNIFFWSVPTKAKNTIFHCRSGSNLRSPRGIFTMDSIHGKRQNTILVVPPHENNNGQPRSLFSGSIYEISFHGNWGLPKLAAMCLHPSWRFLLGMQVSNFSLLTRRSKSSFNDDKGVRAVTISCYSDTLRDYIL